MRKSPEYGFVEETSTTFRKGKINPSRVNFSIKYSEFYILEDRKKSLGKYEFNDQNQIVYYERTDFNQRNARTVTMKHNYDLVHDVIAKETITTVEYLGEGSAQVDTAMYVDYVNYLVEENAGTVKQQNKELEGSYTEYVVQDELLTEARNHIDQVTDITTFTYDAENRCIKMENTLTNEKGKTLSTETKIYYNAEGLVTEVQFYDETGTMLEKDLFTYK
ncbi:MAG: hypothetical protein MK078_18545 [Crocinitomicaceae bacterium]|nr:hypothetical protein [Crocinitomicaceae bacterium]